MPTYPFVFYDRNFLNKAISFRDHETKLGECVRCLENPEGDFKKQLIRSDASFVIIGIPEDIGIKANLGRAGAQSAWEQALYSLLNIQSNTYLQGSEIFVLGHFNFPDLQKQAEKLQTSIPADLEKLRILVSEMDRAITRLITEVISCNKKVIVIGGGHNNAYPCIKSASLAFNQKINVINFDPHSDFRNLEGRHSGNAFSYAKEEGLLDKYVVFGLHENYSPDTITQRLLNDTSIHIHTFEELFIRKEKNVEDSLMQSLTFLSDKPCGIELDMDGIAQMPSSAISPTGFSLEQIRHYIHVSAKQLKVPYFHIAEGAPALAPNTSNNQVGKAIAYLVSDFIKAVI